MNRLEIPERKIDVQYPSTWDEIGEQHACRIGEIMHMAYKGVIDYDMARKLVVDEFLNRVNGLNKPMYGEQSLEYWSNESKVADTVNFLFEKSVVKPKKDKKRVSKANKDSDVPQEVVTINPKFCTQLIPRIRIGWRWYKGPKDMLADLTILEWKETSWRIGKFARTQEESYLDEIFVVLYLRKTEITKREIDRAKKVSLGIKFMIYLYFIGCMNWIREEPIEIDGEEIYFGCLFPKTSSDQGDGNTDGDNTGLAGILFQMAESGVFGNMEQTSKVSMWDVFLRLYQIHWQIKKMKR